MTERIVCNTSPLLALTKMQTLDAVGKLPFQFICPAEVEAEILAGAKQGYQIEIPTWLTVVPLAVAALDADEAAVI